MDPGHPLARHRSLKVTDLRQANLVLPPPGRPLRKAIEAAITKAGGDLPPVAAEADSWSQMLYFAALGVGVAVVNGCVSLNENLVGRAIADLPEVTYSAIHQSVRQEDSAVRQLIDALQTAMP